MFGKQLFEEVSAKISETIANSPAKDMEKNVKAMLGSAFNGSSWRSVWQNSKPRKSLSSLPWKLPKPQPKKPSKKSNSKPKPANKVV